MNNTGAARFSIAGVGKLDRTNSLASCPAACQQKTNIMGIIAKSQPRPLAIDEAERETPCRAAPSRAMARRWQSDTRDASTAGTTGLLRQPDGLAVVIYRRTLPGHASMRDP